MGEPYQAPQKDFEGVTRQVWLFPVKRVMDDHTPISMDVFVDSQILKEKAVKKRTTEELLNSVKQKVETERRSVLSSQFIRDPVVGVLAKRRADGKCQLCNQDAPFITSEGEPYLETHHITWLSKNGSDTLDNTVALCPNCHRKMHVLNKKKERERLRLEAMKPISRARGMIPPR